MIFNNLLKNSISAYFAAIEIHNKPNIEYRYETVTLLLMNAWELALKAYIRKNIKGKSIFEKNGENTISLSKSLMYVNDDINKKSSKKFIAVRKNIEKIEKYRNEIVHFYSDNLEPYIFMLVARAALNYVEFIKTYFNKDIMQDDGLFIMPLGFKLPFKPEEFLSKNYAKYLGGKESKEFIKSIVSVTEELEKEGVSDSIVLGFNIYFESVKKNTNKDILAAITSVEESEVKFSKILKVTPTNDPSAQKIMVSDEQYVKIWNLDHQDLVNWCKKNIKDFKQNREFNKYKKILEKDRKCTHIRKLDPNNSKSQTKKFYSEYALEKLKELYSK